MRKSQDGSSIKYLRNSIDEDFPVDSISFRNKDAISLTGSYHTVLMNYNRLCSNFDGDLEVYPVISAENNQAKIDTEIMEIKSELDNYLGSVYSYNEHLREILNSHMKDENHIAKSSFIFENRSESRTLYSKKLEIVLGTRVVTQHGGYNSIDTEKVESNVDGLTYRVLVLDIPQFKEYKWRDKNKPDIYIRSVKGQNRLNLMRVFHDFDQHFRKFNSACLNVLSGNPSRTYEQEPDSLSEVKDRFNKV